MQRSEVESLIREISKYTGEKEFLLVGSQSIYVLMDYPPDVFKNSVECDFYREDSEWIKKIREKFGLQSAFAIEVGYHADPIGAHVVKMPPGWKDRLVTYKLGDIICKAPLLLDLAACKLMAGREKDLMYVHELVSWGFVNKGELLERVRTMGTTDDPNVHLKLKRFEEYQNSKARVQRQSRNSNRAEFKSKS